MYNQSSQHRENLAAAQMNMSPRISFSNDFAESSAQHQKARTTASRDSAPVSSDFEFSVTNYSMMNADELFSKGRWLPFKSNLQKTTLREELLAGEEEDDAVSLRPPKGSGSTRWKGFLGLKKSHIGSKKTGDKSDGSGDKRVHVSNTSQEHLNDGGSSCREAEFRV
ncbi:hypothetical protein RJ639_005426 [Escallonia herrerae]|uniref:Uncharacterized protein n=1 Tax=Escallonia herrerae TaxID=1293975 RepID=A0AA88VUL1_9ASTE|nr:hypothetical protein RJ639_005426 [Escallonia herrerae]